MSEMSVETSYDQSSSTLKVYAKIGKVIVGSAFGGIEGTSTTLDTIQVNSTERRKGMRSQILEAFEKQAKQAGGTTITGKIRPEFGLNQEKTVAFYKKNGYDVLGSAFRKEI